MKKRLLSTLMALSLALSLLPAAALADEGDTPGGSQDPVIAEDLIKSPAEVEDDTQTGLGIPDQEASPSTNAITPELLAAGTITQETQTLTTGEYTLSADVSRITTITVPEGEEVVLDLAGHTLNAGASVAAITNEGSLTIKDSIGNGHIIGKRGVDNYGSLTVEGGTIQTPEGSDSIWYACVFMRGTASSLTVTGGELVPSGEGVYAVNVFPNAPANHASIELSGGEIGDIFLYGNMVTLDIGKANGTATDVHVGAISANRLGTYTIDLHSGTVQLLPATDDNRITYGALNALIKNAAADTGPGGYEFVKTEGGYYLQIAPDALIATIIRGSESIAYPSMGTALRNLNEGDVLQLNQDYTISSSADCIQIEVPNVTLDLNGHNIEVPSEVHSIANSPIRVMADGGIFRLENSNATPAQIVPGTPLSGSYTVAAVSASSSGSKIVTVEVGENITLVNKIELGGGTRTEAVNLSDDRTNLCTVQTGNGGSDGYIYSFKDLNVIAGMGSSTDPVTVTLLGDVTSGIQYSSTASPMIVDLNGYTASSSRYGNSVISIPDGHDGVNLTIQNGRIDGTEMSAASVLSEDCELTLNQLHMTSGGDFGIAANGGARGSSQSSAGLHLTVTNCSLQNNASSQETVGIFFPAQEGNLTIENSQITGYNVGVQAFTGTVAISGDQTRITGSGEKKDNMDGSSLATSGPLFDGAAVSIIERVNEGGGENIYGDFGTITISGGTFTTDSESETEALHVSQYQNVTSGDGYTDDFENKPQGGSQIVQVTGGTFSSEVDESYCADGYAATQKDGQYVVEEDPTASFVAQVNDGTKYQTLQAAINAAGTNDTVKLLADVSLTEDLPIPAEKNFTLDLNGRYISSSDATCTLAVLGTLKILDSSEGKNGKIENTGTGTSSNNFALLITGTSADVTIEGGNIVGKTGIQVQNGAALTVADGII